MWVRVYKSEAVRGKKRKGRREEKEKGGVRVKRKDKTSW